MTYSDMTDQAKKQRAIIRRAKRLKADIAKYEEAINYFEANFLHICLEVAKRHQRKEADQLHQSMINNPELYD
jgi:hypothetical protein